MTDERRRIYQRESIVFPFRVLTRAEAETYRRACDELEASMGGKPRTVEVRQMHLHFKWAYELASHPRLLDAAESILGPNLLIWATELFTKHPHDGAISIKLHRDRDYMGFEPGTSTTAWLALSNSTPANGCMRVVPEGQQDSSSSEDLATDVILRAGEASLHDAQILHGSNPNHSDEKRVGFVVRFVSPAARPLVGRPPAILVRGSDDHNQFELMDAPQESDLEQALSGMKKSAAMHFDAMLEILKQNTS